MIFSEIAPDIRYCGVNDRTTHLFEALWTLPKGVSYNSYLILGEQIALIDTVDAAFTERFLDQIREQIGDRPIDYLIINHMEPDHSASISALRRVYPSLRIVGNARTLQMLNGYYSIDEGTITVKDGDAISLGPELTLKFHLTPMVHWPETMITRLCERSILFSGDAFGAFGALDGAVTDVHPFEEYVDEIRRYYATIVGKYGTPVQQALAKFASVDIKMICPTHGPVWQHSVDRIIDLYNTMSRYETEPGVVIAYGSMYGNTEQMAERIARSLAEKGVNRIICHNLSTSDPSVVLRDIFRYNGLIIGSTTYNGGIFPPTAALLEKIASRGIPRRHFAAFGSFSWGNASSRLLGEFAQRMKWEPLVPVGELKQGFKESESGQLCDTIASAMAEALSR